MLYPREQTPPFEADLYSGGRWRLSEQSPRNFTMIVVYRGVHCPICKSYVTALNEQVAEFEALGVAPFIVSSDSRERAERATAEWDISQLPLGYGLDFKMGASWGLYISDKLREAEPPQFFEPGMFLIRPDQTLFYTSVQNMPFGRPEFGQLLAALNRVLEMNIPARGQIKLTE